jgi:hypothetical protein
MRPPRSLLAALLATSLLFVASCGVTSGSETAKKDTSKTSSDERTNSDDTSSDSTDKTTTTADTSSDTTSDDTTTDDTSSDLTPEQQKMANQLTSVYEKLGLDHDKAACLGRELAPRFQDGDITDMSDSGPIMDAVNACDISMAELAELGLSGDGTPEGSFKIGLETAFEEAGMTADQASCVADGYVEKYGTDASAASDPQKMIALFQSCGVDPSTLNN